MNDHDDKDLTLRSPKMRNLLSEIPPVPLRIGVLVILIIILAIILSLIFLPYPYSGGETIIEHLTASAQ